MLMASTSLVDSEVCGEHNHPGVYYEVARTFSAGEIGAGPHTPARPWRRVPSGIAQLVARRAHIPEAAGSIPAPATQGRRADWPLRVHDRGVPWCGLVARAAWFCSSVGRAGGS